MTWTYFEIDENFLVRIDVDSCASESSEDNGAHWEDDPAWFGEVHFNGRGARISAPAATKTLANV